MSIREIASLKRVIEAQDAQIATLKEMVALLEAPARREVRQRHRSNEGLQTRVARELASGGRISAIDLAKKMGAKLESVRAALSKLVAEGRVRKVATGVYESSERTFCSMAEVDQAFFPNVPTEELKR